MVVVVMREVLETDWRVTGTVITSGAVWADTYLNIREYSPASLQPDQTDTSQLPALTSSDQETPPDCLLFSNVSLLQEKYTVKYSINWKSYSWLDRNDHNSRLQSITFYFDSGYFSNISLMWQHFFLYLYLIKFKIKHERQVWQCLMTELQSFL